MFITGTSPGVNLRSIVQKKRLLAYLQFYYVFEVQSSNADGGNGMNSGIRINCVFGESNDRRVRDR